MTRHFFHASEIESKFRINFKNKKLLFHAFVHRSYWNEHRLDIEKCNEELEFVGDAAIELVISEYLYQRFPTHAEGELSFLRARIVEKKALAHFARKLDMGNYVLLGRGESKSGGSQNESILADLFEAFIGALFLDAGYSEIKEFIFYHYLAEIEKILASPLRNWKAELQDLLQKNKKAPPQYELVAQEGPPHEPRFKVAVMIGGKKVGEGIGLSKKEAEQNAAKDFLEGNEDGEELDL